jgi:NhaP-type Na+/H+ or K+/H+ antiporter
MWQFIFGMSVGVTLGFVLAAVMAAGKKADADMERLEQILRREP